MAWYPPGAGDLKQRVSFSRRTGQTNVGGVVKTNFATLIDSRRGRLIPLRGGEQVQADRMTGTSFWELTIRSDAATRLVTTDDRVTDARDPTRFFDIRFAEDLEGRGRWIVMQLEKGIGDGGQGA